VRALLRAAWPAGEPEITAMRENLEPEYRPWRLGATLFTTFGVVALLVAVVGIYGIVSYSVSQRRREFGVRMALGAGTGNVLQQVVGESARTIAVGIALRCDCRGRSRPDRSPSWSTASHRATLRRCSGVGDCS
jgi:putative ABC transport system permease protein